MDGIVKKMQEEGVPFSLKQLALRGTRWKRAAVQAGKDLHKLLLWAACDGSLNNEKTLKKTGGDFFGGIG